MNKDRYFVPVRPVVTVNFRDIGTYYFVREKDVDGGKKLYAYRMKSIDEYNYREMMKLGLLVEIEDVEGYQVLDDDYFVNK